MQELINTEKTTSIYSYEIQNELIKLLSSINRETFSHTYGCADRNYWAWKFVDFPGSRFQEISLLLAMLGSGKITFQGKGLCEENFLSLANGALLFWASLQHNDGSFDEAYPFERSLAATAFTSFYCGSAILVIDELLPRESKGKLLHALTKAGDWLSINDEKHGLLSNHLAAAAAALHVIYQITGELKYKKRSTYFIDRVLCHQDDEGWYEEYGGADVGYQTHTVFYLATIWLDTKDERILKSLKKSSSYLAHFIHPDGSFGGEYMSRNTRFFMPAGFEILANDCDISKNIKKFMVLSIRSKSVVTAGAMDSYNILPLVNNFCFAHVHSTSKVSPISYTLPWKQTFVKNFKFSGHQIISTKYFYLIISQSKGGAFAVFDKQNKSPYVDAGAIVFFNDKKIGASNRLNHSNFSELSNNTFLVNSNFHNVNQPNMSPLKFVCFRLFSLAFALMPSASYFIKKALVNILITNTKKRPSQLSRKFEWDGQTLTVKDVLLLNNDKLVERCLIGGRFSTIHMGSSRYAEWQEAHNKSETRQLSKEEISILNRNRLISFAKTLSFSGRI